ncbi:hypothetical protein [Longimonas halophila]|uniref:hypothetical protein n=1 Tax=Longimonas halophila TaxID=1469170 RepID=UPI001596ED85|nr:hypothetical protein [Longimonas halophila]
MSFYCPLCTLATVGLVIVVGAASLATASIADYSLHELDMTYDELERELFNAQQRNGF